MKQSEARRGRWTRRCAGAVCAAVTVLSLSACRGVAQQAMPRPGADAALSAWWSHYRETFIAPEGRVVRPQNDRDTVSEGQAYAALFAVLLNDAATFDRIHAWTSANLSRRERFGDHLLAWHWRDGGVADWMSASDAHLDYALALLLAARRWGRPELRAEAIALARDVLDKETSDAPFGLLLLPGAWGRESDGSCVINPSYYAPAVFRILRAETGDARWEQLVESAYRVWEESGRRLGTSRGAGLPPDWCSVTPEGEFAPAPGRSKDYGWDALRLPMRVGLDALWGDPVRAGKLLSRTLKPFFRRALRGGRLPAAEYAYWGASSDVSESLAMTAMVLFAFEVSGESPPPHLDAAFEAQRTSEAFVRDYYAQSLVFFPLALRAGILRAP